MVEHTYEPATALEMKAERPTTSAGLAAILVVAIVVAVVFQPTLDCAALIFDDNYYLTDNELVTNPGWNSTSRFLTEVLEPSTVAGYYQPLAMISLMIDVALGATPDNVYPIQRTSFLLHVGNSVLVAVFFLVLFRNAPAAVAAGLLFGLHPTATETVPWLAQRKSLLATFFVLACLVTYVRFTRAGGAPRYVLAALFYVLALTSKPTSTPLPALLLLLDWWPLRRLDRRAFVEKTPLFLIGGIFAVITVISQSRTGGAEMPNQHGPMRIPMVLAHNIVFYIRQAFWPGDLPGYYIFPQPFTPSHPAVISGVIGTVLLVVALALSLRLTRAWLCGWLFLIIAIFPTLGVIGFTDTIAANRFLYLPMIGLLLPIAHLVKTAWLNQDGRRARRTAVVAVLLVVCGLEAFSARRALGYWRNSIDYFTHVASVAPGAPKVRYSYGEALDRTGATAEAAEQYRAAIRLRPDYSEAHNNLAAILTANGDLDGAVRHYRRAIESGPASFRAYNNLGVTLIQAGRTPEAIPMLEHAIALNPRFVDARFNLGRVLAGAGRFDEALEQLQRAHDLQPDDLEILYNLALAFDESGQTERAVDRYRAVIALDPNYPGAGPRLRAAEARTRDAGP